MLALPGREEGDAAPRGVAPQGPAHIEMAAALALARLAVALAQPARDLANQMPHLLDLPRLDPGQRRVAQDLVAQIFGFLASIQHQRLRDGFANGVAQPVQCGLQPFRQRRVGRSQMIEVVAKPLDAHGFENAAREYAALGEVADVGKRGRARSVGDRGGNLVAVLRQQHLRQRAEILRRIVAAAGVIVCAGFGRFGTGFRFVSIAVVGCGLSWFGLIEEQVEAIAQRFLLVLALGERQQKRIAQDRAIGKADLRHRAHRVDAFGRRQPYARPPRRTKEAMQVLSHRATRRRPGAKPWR